MKRTRILVMLVSLLLVFSCTTAFAASNADTMFVHTFNSMNEFSGSRHFLTTAYLRNINVDSSITPTLIFGDENYSYSNGLLINSVLTTSPTNSRWTYNSQEALYRARNLVDILCDYSAKSGWDPEGSPPPADYEYLARLNKAGRWTVFGFDSAYMSGRTQPSGHPTYEWELLPFYIEQDETIVKSAAYLYFRVLAPTGKGNEKYCHEYVVGNRSDVKTLINQLLKLNKNIDSWDKSMMNALIQ